MFWICFDCQSVKGNNSKYQRRCYQLCKLRMRVGTIPFIPIALPDGWDDELPSRCTNVTWDTPPSLSCVALRSNRMHQSFHWTLLWKMHPRKSCMPSKVINQMLWNVVNEGKSSSIQKDDYIPLMKRQWRLFNSSDAIQVQHMVGHYVILYNRLFVAFAHL